jgi:hypothetical protein
MLKGPARHWQPLVDWPLTGARRELLLSMASFERVVADCFNFHAAFRLCGLDGRSKGRRKIVGPPRQLCARSGHSSGLVADLKTDIAQPTSDWLAREPKADAALIGGRRRSQRADDSRDCHHLRGLPLPAHDRPLSLRVSPKRHRSRLSPP